MRKKIISMLLVLAVTVTGIGVCSGMTAEQVFAKSSTPYQYLNTDGGGTPREKVGKYYIWSTEGSTEKLVCAKSLSGKRKTLKSISAKSNKTFAGALVTNGSTIYYAILDFNTWKTTIYKTNVKGAKSKKIKTVDDRFSSMAGYYNGSVYYTARASKKNPNAGFNLVSYDISKKKTRTAKKKFYSNSSYGKYFSGAKGYGGNYTQYLYNAKTKKTKKLKKAQDSQVSGKKVYYLCEANQKSSIYKVKSSSLSGKSLKTVKTIKKAAPLYFGKKCAYFVELYDGPYSGDTITETILKLNYKTKKVTKSTREVPLYD
ncbi:hypothetical protein NE619_15340 [Anaerovorax odorimutans]|uniref:DUF5050 domain-containing protein n=1 Tax=Anaerovorax odorimutans TaxID=109327 RepID=A0ABT1RSG8_9FIRM|nr:hypothetical protein [Anaerovorax odorimutans]MCQ4638110.1 hypothetical protein [Anaerovorax odorimutans]